MARQSDGRYARMGNMYKTARRNSCYAIFKMNAGCCVERVKRGWTRGMSLHARCEGVGRGTVQSLDLEHG